MGVNEKWLKEVEKLNTELVQHVQERYNLIPPSSKVLLGIDKDSDSITFMQLMFELQFWQHKYHELWLNTQTGE